MSKDDRSLSSGDAGDEEEGGRVPKDRGMGSDSESSAASRGSSSRNDGTTTASSSGSVGRGNNNRPSIAREESKAVRKFRLVLIAALVLSAAGVAVAVYLYTTANERSQFEVAFQVDSVKVMEGIGRAVERTLASLDEYQVSLLAYARSTNQEWPFVLFPKFVITATKARRMGEGLYMSVHPLVTRGQRDQWENFTLQNDAWLNESMKVQATDSLYYGPVWYNHSILPYIHDSHYQEVPSGREQMLPSWYSNPLNTRYPAFNLDLLSSEHNGAIVRSFETNHPVLGEAYNLLEDPEEPAIHVDFYRDILEPEDSTSEPISYFYYPLIDWDMDELSVLDKTYEDSPEDQPQLVGMTRMLLFWRNIVEDLLSDGSNGIDVVFLNPCTPAFTYRIQGRNAEYRGADDFHEASYEHLGVNDTLLTLNKRFTQASKYSGIPVDKEYCPYTLAVYPSGEMQASYSTANPIYFTVATVLIFAFTSLLFIVYDKSVEARQRKVMNTAVRAETIVQSLYPAVVRDRLFPTEDPATLKYRNSKTEIKSYLSGDASSTNHMDDADGTTANGILYKTPPIAELYPETTVLFADIVGFTAWCSQRSPSQVFTLLETLYGSFDSIARRRGVFKVETIGDSYVAVAGLPEPRPDHAVVMARFARDCRAKMSSLVDKLGKTMGPDTSELRLRFGLNSGPVTAGVLRGDRSRFQLFGDTVNCAARMESNGKPDMIQVSQKTADLLVKAGKENWLQKRQDLVDAKGKGSLQTYWVDPPRRVESDSQSELSNSDHDLQSANGSLTWKYRTDYEKLEKLIEWNTETFTLLLKGVVAWRAATASSARSQKFDAASVSSMMEINPRAEITEVVTLPDVAPDFKSAGTPLPNEIVLSTEVKWQLRDYISSIAYMYRENPFHNFEHASHVASATMKLLQRVISPDLPAESASGSGGRPAANATKALQSLVSNLHSSTYGITSDPLTQFALVFAALVHDVDHRGVSNGQLAAERDPLALRYNSESVAEQNSVAVAWELLLRPCYADLRSALFGSGGDVVRFRQLLVNSVMATDIFDPKLKAMREARWSKAFSGGSGGPGVAPSSEDVNRMATIVIEHLIQAGDVSHTMQHWHVYRKWNTRLFQEMYVAHLAGRNPAHPADGWYKGELWFFDNYVIPLAQKLRECKVFGASCDELLTYAIDNRNEWEARGEQVVAELVEQAGSMSAGGAGSSGTPDDPAAPPPPSSPRRRGGDNDGTTCHRASPTTASSTSTPPSSPFGNKKEAFGQRLFL